MRKFFVIIFICLSAVAIAQTKNLVIEGTAPNLYINHKVSAGESLFSLARKYNQSVQAIASFNSVAADKGLLLGQTVKVPLTSQNLASPGETLAMETTFPLYHIVGKNETLFRIGTSLGATLPEVKQWNNLSSDNITAGTPLIVGHLKIVGSAAATPSKSPTPAAINSTSKNDVNDTPVKPAAEPKKEAPVATTIVEEKKQEASVPPKVAEIKQEPSVAAASVGEKKQDPAPVITTVEEKKQQPAAQKTEATPTQEPVVQKIEPALNDKPLQQQTAKLQETKKLDLLAPEPQESNEGVFSGLYSMDVAQKSLTNKTGDAATFKSTSGWQDKKYYVLMNDVPAGTILKISSPDNRYVFAKVLGNMPEMKENRGLLLRISNAAASYLGMVDSKFPVQVTFYQ